MGIGTIRDLGVCVQQELTDRLIPFWTTRAEDKQQGGFIGYMSYDGVIQPDAPKGLILNARLLWTYASLVRFNNNAACRRLARRAYDYLNDNFLDQDKGGYFWMVDAKGQCLDDLKKIYGQAFVVYALAAYARTLEDAEVLDRALTLFDLIEGHAHDDQYLGYIEVCRRDWSVAEDTRLSDKDMDTPKSMNNHLHILEAYTGLYTVRPEGAVKGRLMELIDVFVQHIHNPEHRHLDHFFDLDWQRQSDTYTFGHDIEASWLLWEAVEALDDPDIKDKVRPLVLDLARVTLEQGIDPGGGLYYEGHDGHIVHPYRDWWCQAEAVVGFFNAFALSGDVVFQQAALAMWDAIERDGMDREQGEWFWRVDTEGHPDMNEPKISEWKGSYHNVRACLEILRRLADGE